MYAIEANALKKEFRKRDEHIWALKGVDLKVEKGRIYGLLGPNGAGKTTMIYILSTLLLPTSGSAKVLGYDVVKDDDKVRERIGMCIGGTSFYHSMTPVELLQLYGRLYGLNSQKRKERIKKLIDDLEITEFKNKNFITLSTGMKQKVAIAKSLINEPEVLFLDEPTAGIDVEVSKNIRAYIANLVKEKEMTVILTSHHLKDVEELCKEISIIDEGKIIAEGNINKIRKKVKFPDIIHLYLSNYRGLEFLRKLKGVEGYEVTDDGLFIRVYPGIDVVSNIINQIKKRKMKILDIEVEKASLEDIFMKIVGDQCVR